MSNVLKPVRDPAPMLEKVLHEWGGHDDLWIFGYGSLTYYGHPAKISKSVGGIGSIRAGD